MATTADLIAQFEGFSTSPYWDVNAYRAGFGSDTVTMPDGSVVPIRQGMSVTREDALRDLDRRISSEFQPSVVNALGADTFNALSPAQQSVLTSLAYNYGAGAWGKGLSGVASAVQTPGTEDDIAAIRALSSHNDGINAKRRNKEADIYAGLVGGYGDGYTPASEGMDAQGQRTNALDPAMFAALAQSIQSRQPELPQFQMAEITPYQMQGTQNALVPQYSISPLAPRFR